MSVAGPESGPGGPALHAGVRVTSAEIPARQLAGAVLLVAGWHLGAGVLVGVLWWLVAPTVVCTSVGGDCLYESFEGGLFFIAEGRFAVLAAACGVVAALLVRRRLSPIGWPVVVALAVGGAVGSLVAWRVGVWLGPEESAGLTMAVGALAEEPLRLRSGGLLLVWSITSVIVALLMLLAETESAPGAGEADGVRALPDPGEVAAWTQHAEAVRRGPERSTR